MSSSSSHGELGSEYLDLNDLKSYMESCEKQMKRVARLFDERSRYMENKLIRHERIEIKSVTLKKGRLTNVQDLMGGVDDWYEICELDEEECDRVDSNLKRSGLYMPELEVVIQINKKLRRYDGGEDNARTDYKPETIHILPKINSLAIKEFGNKKEKLFISFWGGNRSDKFIKEMLDGGEFEETKDTPFPDEAPIDDHFVVHSEDGYEETTDQKFKICTALFKGIIQHQKDLYDSEEIKFDVSNVERHLNDCKRSMRKVEVLYRDYMKMLDRRSPFVVEFKRHGRDVKYSIFNVMVVEEHVKKVYDLACFKFRDQADDSIVPKMKKIDEDKFKEALENADITIPYLQVTYKDLTLDPSSVKTKTVHIVPDLHTFRTITEGLVKKISFRTNETDKIINKLLRSPDHLERSSMYDLLISPDSSEQIDCVFNMLKKLTVHNKSIENLRKAEIEAKKAEEAARIAKQEFEKVRAAMSGSHLSKRKRKEDDDDDDLEFANLSLTTKRRHVSGARAGAGAGASSSSSSR